MIKNYTCMTLFALSLLTFERAVAANVASWVDESCRVNSQDPFDYGWRISEKADHFSNLCVNAKSVRPITILRKTAKAWEFANLYHRQSFWKAKWDAENLPKVSFLIVHFASGIPLVQSAHTELLLEFPRGLEVISQTTGEQDSVDRIVVSWEAVFTHGATYNLLTGLSESYPIAGRFVSLEARIPENLPENEEPRKIESYPLDLTPSEAGLLFENLILQSHAWKYDHFYNTFSPNCTTRPFDILDSVLQKTRGIRVTSSFVTGIKLDPIAGPSRKGLLQRALVSPGQPAIPVTDLFLKWHSKTF